MKQRSLGAAVAALAISFCSAAAWAAGAPSTDGRDVQERLRDAKQLYQRTERPMQAALVSARESDARLAQFHMDRAQRWLARAEQTLHRPVYSENAVQQAKSELERVAKILKITPDAEEGRR